MVVYMQVVCERFFCLPGPILIWIRRLSVLYLQGQKKGKSLGLRLDRYDIMISHV